MMYPIPISSRILSGRANFMEQTHVGSRHGARRLADRCLIDLDDALQRFPAGDFFVAARSAGELPEVKLERFVKYFSYQCALAGAGDAGDTAPETERNLDVDIF